MKVFSGKVTGMKMAKTLTVEVERFLAHPVYKKRYKRNRKYQVHSEVEHKLGDIVRFFETAPISKTKKWRVLEDNKKTEVKKEVKKIESKTKTKKEVKTKKGSK